MTLLDSAGVDVGPIIEEHAQILKIPRVGLVALGKAESDWRYDDARYGTWPDWSFGYGHITVQTAKGYGIGDGTPDTAFEVRLAMRNRYRAIGIMAAHYRSGLITADAYAPELRGDDRLLAGMVVYNSGSYQEPGNWWYQKWAGNVATYRASLAWAHERVA